MYYKKQQKKKNSVFMPCLYVQGLCEVSEVDMW